MRKESLNDAFDALSDVRRRNLLIALLDHDPPDASPTVDGAGNGADTVERRIQMHHVHLPKLAAYGFVEWDEEAGKVSEGPGFDEIRPVLELLADREDELPDDWL